MTAGDSRAGRPPAIGVAVLLSVALVSAALIAYEVVLMRRLLIERWHHFGFLVISVALLGFGASGTLLAVIERYVRRRPVRTLRLLAIGLAILILIVPRAAARIPIAAQFIPSDLWRQAGWWCLYWMAAMLPFVIGAAHIGAALMTAGERVGRVYAVNLIGSAIGAIAAALLISRAPIEYALLPSLVAALIAVLVLPAQGHAPAARRWVRIGFAALVIFAAGVLEWRAPLRPDYDQHKYAAYVGQLAAQGSARRVDRAFDPHGYVELYESDLFHDLPFVAIGEAPPPMYSLLINGDAAGSVLRIDDASQAGVMDRTLMALPYRLIRERPRVLLLGETGGTNVWLARRRSASRIELVQSNAGLLRVISGHSPALFDGTVTVHVRDSRGFVDAIARPRFDLIQIASLEGLAVGGGGGGLAEDHLLTVEGLAACLRALSDRGALAVTRGMQEPPRDNIRILATMVEALESIGVEEVAKHIVQVRDYLGACTIALRRPIDDQRRRRLRAAMDDFNLTPIWFDGLRTEEVNRPDEFPGPADSTADWLHHAAAEIFSPRRQAFYDSWMLNVRPPTDDAPFFGDFYKPEAVDVLKRAYGPLWLTRAEMGRLFLYASLVVASAAAVILILLPLAATQWRRARSVIAPSQPSAAAIVVYFSAIGLGFMGVEMALISRAIRILGDPVIASAAVIAGVLLLSGLGSLSGPALLRGRLWLAPGAVAAAALIVLAIGWSGGGSAALLLTAVPLAYAMGMPMPAAIALLNERRPNLVPWAWGVNGVASVIATSAAIVIAMTLGYRWVILAAAAFYALAAAVAVYSLRPASEPDSIVTTVTEESSCPNPPPTMIQLRIADRA